MIKNSLIIALRNFFRKPAFSIINVLGLAIGIACFVLTMVYVHYELSYDNFQKNKGRIHLVTLTMDFADYFIENHRETPATLAETLKATFPEVQTATQTRRNISAVIRHGESVIKEEHILGADSSFFDVFTCDFIFGDPETALNEPRSMVISERIAKKYFGDGIAYGETLNFYETEFKITGVIKDLPKNSLLDFNILFSLYTFEGWYNDPQWQQNNWCTYLVTKEGVDPMQVEAKFPELIKRHMLPVNGQDFESWLADGNRWEYHLFSLEDVHLVLNGNGIYLLGFGIVAVFLLIIAIINYMNLSTAKAAQRAKEVGIRKSVGACRFTLIYQFLGESIFMSFLSLIIGMGIVEATLPSLSEFVNKNLTIHYFDNLIILPLLITLGLIIGILSGLYPSFVLSSYIPVKVLKGNISKQRKGFNLRSILVFLQFLISISLIISLIIVVKQTELLYNKNLGYNKDNLLVIRNASVVQDRKDVFKTEISKIPGIENITFTSRVPNKSRGQTSQWTPQGKEETLISVHMADYDFLKTMEIDLHAGRYFSKEFALDSSAAVLNQAAMRLLGWGDTLHRTLDNQRNVFHVIGVIKDYHFQTLHNEIKPFMILLHGGKYELYNYADFITMRLKPGVKPPIEQIEYLWKRFAEATPFEYFFFDEQYKSYYEKEKQTSNLMLILTILILFVTAMGLFGLASFATQERMKEIAIRKAIGSSVLNIVYKMTWSFTKLVLVANIVAWPLAWYFMNDWLNGYATRINMSWWIFVLAALLSYLLAIATIIFQAYSAAKKNPVDVLRYE